MADAPMPDARALAKAWLVELVAAAPLDDVERLPARELAREGPELCAAVVAALRDDGALSRLRSGPTAVGAGALAGAEGDPAATVAALEALRSVVWRALAGGLVDPDPRLLADLADRLGAVLSVVAGAALAGATEPGRERSRTVAADEAAPAQSADAGRERAPDPEPPPPGTVRAQDTRAAVPAGGAAPWMAGLERLLERRARDARPFAVMVVELEGLARLRAGDVPGAQAAAEAAERALAAELRPGDALLREDAERLWLLAPDTEPPAARALAERLAGAVAEAAEHQGAPLRATVGVAHCPSDGEDAAGLVARADLALWSARAGGVPVGDPSGR